MMSDDIDLGEDDIESKEDVGHGPKRACSFSSRRTDDSVQNLEIPRVSFTSCTVSNHPFISNFESRFPNGFLQLGRQQPGVPPPPPPPRPPPPRRRRRRRVRPSRAHTRR